VFGHVTRELLAREKLSGLGPTLTAAIMRFARVYLGVNIAPDAG